MQDWLDRYQVKDIGGGYSAKVLEASRRHNLMQVDVTERLRS